MGEKCLDNCSLVGMLWVGTKSIVFKEMAKCVFV